MCGLGSVDATRKGPSYRSPKVCRWSPGSSRWPPQRRSRPAAATPMCEDVEVGDVVIYAWLGNPEDPETEFSGAGWLRGVSWLPYQRETFVSPAFAAYTSGHSTFSRAGGRGADRDHRQRLLPRRLTASSSHRRTSSSSSSRDQAKRSDFAGLPIATPPTRPASRACGAASTFAPTTSRAASRAPRSASTPSISPRPTGTARRPHPCE